MEISKPVIFRRLFRWKTLFYGGVLPLARRLGPVRGDALIAGLGVLGGWLRPSRRKRLSAAVEASRRALGAGWDRRQTTNDLEKNIPRFLARDYPLDALCDAPALARFRVTGFGPVRRILDRGEGVILLGSHFGAHLAAIHWLYRNGVSPRLLVQKPRHVSKYLFRQLNNTAYPSQGGFFLRRDLSPTEAAERILRARDALKSGFAVYMAGDIPWVSPNSRPGCLLGRELSFLSVWADLAVIAQVPVVPVFCSHEPGGRFSLSFDPPWLLRKGDENSAVASYLERLESRIVARPADAVVHLLWDCYRPPQTEERRADARHPNPGETDVTPHCELASAVQRC